MEEFTIFVFDTYYISVCVKFGDIFLTARERKILSMCQLSKKKVRNALNMRFRPVAGGEAEGARAPLEIFRFEFNSALRLELCLLKCTAVNGNIVVNRKIIYCYLEWCKGTKSCFCSTKNSQQNICLFFIKIEAKWIEMHQWRSLKLASWTLLVSKRSASVKYTTVLE